MTTHPRIDLSQFPRGELKQLADDVVEELKRREAEDREALEVKLRTLMQEAGFDPRDLRLAGAPKRKARKGATANGEQDE